MSKQTAVEWLIAQILKERKILDLDVESAKKMEREQIQDAFVAGDERGTNEIPFNAEQYYTQTYGNKFLDLVSPETSQLHDVVKKLKEEKNNEQ
jgi:hypothetical protein